MNLYSPQRVTKSCRKLGNHRTHAACLQSAHAEKIRCRRRARAHTHIPSIARARIHTYTRRHRVEELFLRGSRRLALFEGSFDSLFVHPQYFADDLRWQRLPCHCARSAVVPTRAHALSQHARTHWHTHTHRRTHMPTSDHTGARGHATLGERPSCQDARREAIVSRADAVGDEQCSRIGKTSTHAGRNKRARSKTTRACG